MPLIQTDNLKSVVPCNCDVVAVELVEDSKSLIDFHHPERAFYVFGAEDQTLSDETLAWCKHRVSIPTRSCMNLAACVNVVLYDRMAKRNRAYV
jgi:tRNA(Leu) C34 or U34 (ribose-2'-O)-methylase TrmL